MSSDQPYTPSDEDMRDGFVQDMARPENGRRVWDAWLAAHDARVRRDAAREAEARIRAVQDVLDAEEARDRPIGGGYDKRTMVRITDIRRALEA